jgi:hypothetical protein
MMTMTMIMIMVMRMRMKMTMTTPATVMIVMTMKRNKIMVAIQMASDGDYDDNVDIVDDGDDAADGYCDDYTVDGNHDHRPYYDYHDSFGGGYDNFDDDFNPPTQDNHYDGDNDDDT